MGLSVGPRAGGNVLIAGDAGGVINPFNGEGIAYAYETGRLAAAALGHALTGAGASALAEYDRELTAAYGPYYKVARAFVHLISNPEAMRLCVGLGMRSETAHEPAAAHHGEPHATRQQPAPPSWVSGPWSWCPASSNPSGPTPPPPDAGPRPADGGPRRRPRRGPRRPVSKVSGRAASSHRPPRAATPHRRRQSPRPRRAAAATRIQASRSSPSQPAVGLPDPAYGTREGGQRLGRPPPDEDERAGQVGRRRPRRDGEPVDDDPAVRSDQHVEGMEVVVADTVAAVVEPGQQRDELGAQRHVGDARLDLAPQPRHQIGKTAHHGRVQRQLQGGEVPRQLFGLGRVGHREHLEERGSVDPAEHDAAAPLHRHGAVGPGDRDPRVGQSLEHRRLEVREAVPLGPVELEHPALAVGEDLGGAPLGEQFHSGERNNGRPSHPVCGGVSAPSGRAARRPAP